MHGQHTYSSLLILVNCSAVSAPLHDRLSQRKESLPKIVQALDAAWIEHTVHWLHKSEHSTSPSSVGKEHHERALMHSDVYLQPPRARFATFFQAEGVAQVLSGRGAGIPLEYLDGRQWTDASSLASLLQSQRKCCASNPGARYANTFAFRRKLCSQWYLPISFNRIQEC